MSTYARSWLRTGLARGDWRETTAQRYAVALDLHVLPSLGGTYLDALTARLIELALSDWARGYQRATVNSWLRIPRTVLNGAVALGMIASNPARQVCTLRERREEHDGDEADLGNALAPAQLDAYLRSWLALYLQFVPRIVTLALTGLRWGEATALTWAEIAAAESHSVLHVRRSQVRGIIRNTTKTGKRRVVPFPPELALLLTEHRRRLIEIQQLGLKKAGSSRTVSANQGRTARCSSTPAPGSNTPASTSTSCSTACAARRPTCSDERRSTQ